MQDDKQSRREFLGHSGSFLGSSWLALHMPVILATSQWACQAQKNGEGFVVLDQSEVAALSAITECIFPTDATPGAREAGVIYFIDRALDGFMAASLSVVRPGLISLAKRVQLQFPAKGGFSELSGNQQIEMLEEIDETEFFDTVRKMTLYGLFAQPSYGGNRNKIGWQHLGFSDRKFWEPPFGAYDRDYMRDGEDAS